MFKTCHNCQQALSQLVKQALKDTLIKTLISVLKKTLNVTNYLNSQFSLDNILREKKGSVFQTVSNAQRDTKTHSLFSKPLTYET